MAFLKLTMCWPHYHTHYLQVSTRTEHEGLKPQNHPNDLDTSRPNFHSAVPKRKLRLSNAQEAAANAPLGPLTLTLPSLVKSW